VRPGCGRRRRRRRSGCVASPRDPCGLPCSRGMKPVEDPLWQSWNVS